MVLSTFMTRSAILVLSCDMARSRKMVPSHSMARFYDLVLSIHMTRSGCSDSLFCFDSFPNLGSLVVQWTRSQSLVLLNLVTRS